MSNAAISTITMPSGTTYDIKDAQARSDISTLQTAVAGGISFFGITTTALTDGSTATKVTINGVEKDAVNGALCIYGDDEFVYSTADNEWHRFGPAGTFKALAYKDSATGSVTATGSVSVSTATTENKTATVSAAGSGDATYTPAGSISVSTATTENKTATVSAAGSGTATYTPSGTIALATGGAGSTTTIHNPTKATVATAIVTAAPSATAPTNAITYYSVSNENLSLYQIGYSTGDSITTSDVTVKTGDGTYAFSGTGARLVTGNIAVPATYSGSFSGTGARLVTGNIAVPKTYSASFSGDSVSVTVS